MKANTIVKHFEYKGHAFVIVQHESGKFMAIPKEYIDENGRLTRSVWGGYDTIEACITFKKQEVEFKDLLASGMDEMEALRKACAVA